MKYVYVLEKEQKFQKEIFESLQKVDPQLKVRFFDQLETFAQWVNLAIKEGASALFKGGVNTFEPPSEAASSGSESASGDILSLIVCSNEIMGSRSMQLLRKTHELFVRKKLCTPEDPTSIVITAFDDPDFDVKLVEDRIVNNVIYKPFDPMILQQHLNFAVSGRHPPSEYTLHNMKTSTTIEMLKEAQLEKISIAGFVTVSDREVGVGTVSKYYGEEFFSGDKKSVNARCIKCEKHPTLENQFRIHLHYFGLEPAQIKDIRKNLAKAKGHLLKDEPQIFERQELNTIVVLDTQLDQLLVDGLARAFPKATLIKYENWETFEKEQDPHKDPCFSQNNWPIPSGFKIELDAEAQKILNTNPVLKENEKALGLSLENLKKINFDNSVLPHSQDEWKSILNSDQPLSPTAVHVVQIEHEGKRHLIRVSAINKKKNEQGQVVGIELSVIEMAPEDRITFLKKYSRWPSNPDLILMNKEFYGRLVAGEIKLSGKHFFISEKALVDVEKRPLGAQFLDSFISPVDRNFMVMKIKSVFGLLEPSDLEVFEKKGIVKVANPVEVSEISEAGIILKYHRAMTLGAFRKFVLVAPKETEILEYLGNCNYTQEMEGEEKYFQNHFVFFGMKDHFLKYIRLWIRENYIQQKEKAS